MDEMYEMDEMEESSPKKYSQPRPNKLTIPVENIKKDFPAQQRPSTFQRGLIGFFENDSYLIYNVSLMTDDMLASSDYQIFLMDNNDVEYFESPNGGTKNFDALKNLENFLSFKPDKKIYLRIFKVIEQGFESEKVFRDEALTIVPLVFQQQGDPIPTESFEDLCLSWTETNDNARLTINTTLFSVALSKNFDIDNSLITVVNDLSFTWNRDAFLEDGGDTSVYFQNQDGKYMQHPSHVVFSYFTSSVCGVGWENYKEDELLKAKREVCLKRMEEYNIGRDFMVDQPFLANDTDEHSLSVLYVFSALHHSETIPISHYLKMCKDYGIPNYREHIKSSNGQIEVYLARAFMIIGWMELFFEDDRRLDGIRDLLLDGLSSLIPKDNLDEFQYLLKYVFFPVGLYSRNGYFAPRFGDPNKEENDRISKLAAANEKRNQKLQEKKNAKKKKKPEQAVPEKTEPQAVAQNEEEKASEELQQLAEQLGLVYDVNSSQYVKKEDLDTARNSDDVEIASEASESPSENLAKSSKKKNNKKKKKKQEALEKVGVEVAEAAQPAEELEPNEESVTDPVPEPVEPEAANPEAVEPVAAKPEDAEPDSSPPAPRDPNQQSSSCSKCSRTSKKCQEAIKAQNIAQSKADSFESKARRTEEVVMKMREMEEKMRQMKSQLATSLKHSEENERLRQKITKREKIEEDLRKEKKDLIFKNENLEMEVENMKKNMENEVVKNAQEKLKLEKTIAVIESATLEVVNELKIINQIQLEEITDLKDSMSQKQTELFQAKEINGKLHMDNSLLKSKMRRLEIDIEKLREHASQALEPVVMDRRKLLELRKLKDDFGRNTIMEEAREKVDKIKGLPDTTENLAEVLEAAENELIRLETSIYNYQDFLDLNVRIYQKSHDISKILELPEHPKISEGFSDMYSRLFPIRPPVTGIPDTDCPICYEPRLPEEEVLDCNGCPYIFHISCLRTWFKDKPGCTVCPQCQQPLRDPDQYPALG